MAALQVHVTAPAFAGVADRIGVSGIGLSLNSQTCRDEFFCEIRAASARPAVEPDGGAL
jgi:hypothetical protein